MNENFIKWRIISLSVNLLFNSDWSEKALEFFWSVTDDLISLLQWKFVSGP